jgi:iron complex outermembrane recepter protein
MKYTITCVLAACLALPISAFSDEIQKPEESLAPLVVTADLWESELAKLPASVTVYDAETLDTPGISHFADLIERTPNLTFTGGTSRPRYFQLRGLGENSQYEGETPDSAVRFLIDDIDFTGLASVASTFDTRQVEILRGPQAGAFGANAAGGLIRLVSNEPTPFWTGRYEMSAGDDSLFAGGLAVGGPLIARDPEELMFRFSIHHHQSDGFRKNATLNQNTNARDEWTSRLRLLWNPNPDFRIDATLFHADLNNGFDEFALDNNGRLTFSDMPGRDLQRSSGGSIRTHFSGWDNVTLTSITTTTHTDSTYSYDDDWTAASYMGFSDLERTRETLSQELRIDSTPGAARALGVDRWTLGLFASLLDEESAYTNEDPGNIRFLDTNLNAKNFALFGQAGRDLTERDRLTLGLRLEHIRSSGDGLRNRFRKGTETFDPSFAFSSRFSDTLFGGKLAWEHDLNEILMLFASVARGYKGGGINVDARINPGAGDPVSYDTERIWNYEIGLRGNWDRISASLTGFHLDRRNTQVRDSAGFGGNYRFFTDNADKATITGAEMETAITATDALSFYGSLALMSSNIDAFTLSNGNTGGGRTLANTPSYSWSMGARYNHESGFFATVDVTGRNDYFESNNHREKRDAFTSVNTSIGYSHDDWTVSLWVRNLLDERYTQRVFFFGNDPGTGYTTARYESLAPPRQIGVTLSREF